VRENNHEEVKGVDVLPQDDCVPGETAGARVHVPVLLLHDLGGDLRGGRDPLLFEGVPEFAEHGNDLLFDLPELGEEVSRVELVVQGLVQSHLLYGHGPPLHGLVGEQQHSVEVQLSETLRGGDDEPVQEFEGLVRDHRQGRVPVQAVPEPVREICFEAMGMFVRDVNAVVDIVAEIGRRAHRIIRSVYPAGDGPVVSSSVHAVQPETVDEGPLKCEFGEVVGFWGMSLDAAHHCTRFLRLGLRGGECWYRLGFRCRFNVNSLQVEWTFNIV